MSFLRTSFLVLVVVIATRDTPRQEAPSVRITTSYTATGPQSIDTATVTEAFVTGLSADSLLRILPSSPTGESPSVERAQFTVSLQVIGAGQRVLATARVIRATGHVVLTESASADSFDTLTVAIRRLGEQAAQRLVEILRTEPPTTDEVVRWR